MAGLDDCYNVFDLREAARKRLPRGVFEFFDRGTEDEVALHTDRYRRAYPYEFGRWQRGQPSGGPPLER